MSSWTVQSLKDHLKFLNLQTGGLKGDLVRRIKAAVPVKIEDLTLENVEIVHVNLRLGKSDSEWSAHLKRLIKSGGHVQHGIRYNSRILEYALESM